MVSGLRHPQLDAPALSNLQCKSDSTSESRRPLLYGERIQSDGSVFESVDRGPPPGEGEQPVGSTRFSTVLVRMVTSNLEMVLGVCVAERRVRLVERLGVV